GGQQGPSRRPGATGNIGYCTGFAAWVMTGEARPGCGAPSPTPRTLSTKRSAAECHDRRAPGPWGSTLGTRAPVASEERRGPRRAGISARRTPVLVIDGLRVWYGPTEVLRGVTLTVPERAIVALLGGNGSGKSTTLNTVSGFLRPTAGTITFARRRIDGLPTDAIVRAGVVQIPQGREVFSGLTIE